jgi:uncharacterized damage-inducible protein DinB
MAVTKANIIALSDYVYQRTRNRLNGLTDTEYFWQPVADCWTIRRAGPDEYLMDYPDSPGAAPFTTIAWRLWHLAETYGGIRNPRWLGVEREPTGFERTDPAPATAAEAIAALEAAHAFWRGMLQELPADSWQEPLGRSLAPVAGPYAESTKASLVLHQLDEHIHHGAELGVLRDLYRQARASSII